MTAKKRRVPQDDASFNEWYKVFSVNLPEVAETVEVSAGKQARVNNDSAAFGYLQSRKNIINAYKEAESAARNSANEGDPSTVVVVLPTLDLPEQPDGVVINHGIKKYANNLVQQILENPNCTPEIEAFLNIEPKGGEGPDNLTGKIRSAEAKNAGAISLKCLMQGMRGYRVYSMRGDDADFVKIGDSMIAEYLDDRPNLVGGQPEKRQYKIIMLEKNKEIGDFSDVKVVITKP